MKIGFDISQTGRHKAGCGFLAESLIRRMVEKEKSDEFILYPTFGDLYWDPEWEDGTFCSENENVSRHSGHRSFNQSKSFWQNPPNDFEDRLGRPDIIHSNNFFCPSGLHHARLVYTLYDMTFVEHPELTTEENRIGCFNGVFNASLTADFIIAISRYSRDHFLELFPHFPSSRIEVIYPGSRFLGAPRVERPSGIVGLNSHSFWLAVGTLEPRKNLDRLLQAYSRLKAEQNRNIFPLVISGGQGWLMEGFRQRVAELGLENNVVILGYVDEETLLWLYQNCFALVYPSLFEGFGLPVVEAMSQGAPVIASRITSIPEITGKAALLVNPHDVSDIFQAMKHLATQSLLRDQLSTEGRQRAQEFSWAKAVDQYHEVYGRVLNFSLRSGKSRETGAPLRNK